MSLVACPLFRGLLSLTAAQGPAEEVCIDHGVGPVVEQLEDLSCVIETPDQERPLDIEDHQRVDKANPT